MKRTLLFCLLLLTGLTAFSQLKSRLESAYAALEQDPQMKYASASLTVLNTQTGEVVFTRNGDMGLASASTLKTVTAATAYHVLGAEFKYATRVEISGNLATNGVLDGQLIVRGSGDPTLGSWRYQTTDADLILKDLIASVKRSGIRSIAGDLIADDLLFGTQSLPVGWIWQDIGNYYGAGLSGLSWRENQYDLIFEPGAVGQPAKLLRTEPQMDDLDFVNEVTTGAAGTGDNVYVYAAPYTHRVYLRGTYGIDLKKKIAGSVPDPALDFSKRLKAQLQEIGISVTGKATTARLLKADGKGLPSGKVIHTHSSPALPEIVYWFNQKSINLYGEHLLRSVALRSGKSATTPEGVRVLQQFWKEKIGIDPNAMNIVDGSGLSPQNRITTRAMAQILASVKSEAWFDSYFKSLPTYNNMKMKSGSISDVLAYAGYETSSTGEPLAFSFIINNYSGSTSAIRQKMFNVLNTLK